MSSIDKDNLVNQEDEVITEDIIEDKTLAEEEYKQDEALMKYDEVVQIDGIDLVNTVEEDNLIDYEDEGGTAHEVDIESHFARLDELSDEEAIAELDKIMEENDIIEQRSFLGSLISQDDGENLVYYEIENIYRNENTRAYKSRLKMRQDPPVLVIKDDYDNEASFNLTENLTEELLSGLGEVKRAYYGFSKPRALDAPEGFIESVRYHAKNNPLKYSLAAVIALIFLILLIKGMVQ